MSLKKLVTDNLSRKEKAKLGVTTIVKGKDAAKTQAIQKALPKIASESLPFIGGMLVLGLVYWTIKSSIERRKRKKVVANNKQIRISG